MSLSYSLGDKGGHSGCRTGVALAGTARENAGIADKMIRHVVGFAVLIDD